MKLKQLGLLLICVLGIQNVTQAQGRLQFSDMYFMGGVNGTLTGPLADYEVNNLEKDLFQPSTVKPSSTFSDGDWERRVRLNTQIGLMAGWNIRGTRLGNQKIRLGFSAGSYHVNWNNSYQSKDAYRIDTLVSQQTGEAYYIDSTRVRTLNYEHFGQMFNLHFDYLLYLNPGNKLTFYTGVGARFGISLSNTVTSNYSEYDGYNGDYWAYYESRKNDYNNNDWESSYVSNTKTLAPTTNINAHALVGVNYRLSKRNRFLRHIHLFHEMSLGLQLNQMEIIDPSIGFNLGLQSGMRVSFNNRSSKKSGSKKKRRKRY